MQHWRRGLPTSWAPLNDCGGEPVGDREVGSIVARTGAGEQAILEISHDPRAAARATTPDCVVAKVDGLHVTVAGIKIVGLGVAIVKAACPVVVGSVENCIHTLSCVASSTARHDIVAVARAGRDEDTVCLLAIQGDWCTNGAGQVVVTIGFWALEAAGWCLVEMVTTAGLVIDDGDEASRAGTEGVLGRSIRHTTGSQRCDGGCGVVGTTLHLVEDAGVGTIQGASSAVGGNAGGTT